MHNIKNILNDFKEKNVFLFLKKDQLKYKSENKINNDDLVLLKKYKKDIIFYLNNEDILLSEKFPLSNSQKRLWFMDKFEKNTGQYNLSTALKIKGTLNIPLLEKSFINMIERHEILRTLFIEENSEPYQIIYKKTPFKINIFKCEDERLLQEELKIHSDKVFHLKDPILFDVNAYIINEKETYISIAIHHIITDGWSIQKIIEEVTNFYNTKSNKYLNNVDMQYKNYSKNQQHWLKTTDYKNKLSSYNEYLHNMPMEHGVMFDKQRPERLSNEAYSKNFKVNLKKTKKIKLLAQTFKTTPFTILQSIFALLIHKYGEQKDIIMGTSFSGRTEENLVNSLGFFINSVVLRTSIEEKNTIKEYIENNIKSINEIHNYQSVPFDLLVKEKNTMKSLNKHPLFQILFLMNNFETKKIKFNDLQINEVNGVNKENTLYDIEIDIKEVNKKYEISFVGSKDLFFQETITFMGEVFEHLINIIPDNVDIKIENLNILPKKHHEIIIKDFNKNKYELNLKEYSTIVEIFENQVLKNKNKIALIDGYGKSITFKELNKKSNSYANYLKNKGYSNNDIIATCLNREIDSIAFILGIFKSGLVYLPINEDLPSDKIESILLDSKAKEFIVSKNFSNKIKNTSTDILENIILLNHSKDNLNTEINKEDSVYIIYTSGSTGKPKGVEVTHDNWKGYYYSLLKEYPFNDNDRVLQFSNFNFDVFIDELTLSLLNGNSLVLKNENLLSSASSFWEFIDKNEISVLSLTPGLWHQLISTISEKEKEIINERINVCIVGGDSMNKSLLIEWQNITNRKSKIFNVYGPTETTSISSLVDVTDINFENNILTIGTPMHNEEFYILDEKMNPVPIGVKGEIYIGGIGVSKGYLNREKLNEKSFITNKYSEEKNNKFYKTGDLARWLPNGEVQFIGRNDFQVKIRGFRIELGEIEQALSKLNEIKDVVVNPITKNENKHLVAYIILKEEFKNNKNIIKKINNQLKEKLINYMIPEYYEILDTLPLTNNGKVNRKLLPEPNKINKNEKINKKTFNLNPKEVIIEREFKKILKINNINSESNYFENGGDSINALKLISNLNKEGFNITVVDLFTNPTVEDLANLISSSNKGDILKNTILEKIEYDEKLENLFCFHPLSGMSTGYTPLANELSENINTIGINCPDIYGISEHKSIEELTKTYIKYILEVNGDKPINILGYSLGGAFAYEAATQLTELGIEINNLFIIDTPPLPYKIEEDKWYSTISNLLEDEYNKKTDWEYLNSLTKKEQIKEISKIVSTSKYLPVDNLSPELLAPYISFLLNLQESFFNYNAQNTNLDINLILCKPEGNNESEEYFDLWKKKTKGSINVFETKIEHSDILKVENAQEISDIIIELKNKKRIL